MNSQDEQNGQGDADERSAKGRRTFLKMAAATSIVLPGSTAIAKMNRSGHSSRTRASLPTWNIEAARVEKTFADGTVVPFFRYRAIGNTPVAGTVPVLTGRAGELVRLHVRNTLNRTIRPTIVGGMRGPSIAPGAEANIYLIVPSEGTWLLTDDTLGNAAGPMGLGAVIVSHRGAKKHSVVAGGRRRIDREYVLLYTDSDDRWNFDIDNGLEPDLKLYEPNYHTVNNLTFPDTTTDAGTAITCEVGENVLLRLCNLGWMRQSIHFHGYHVDIAKLSNQPQSIYGPKDTVPVPGHTTTEVVLSVNQPGMYPVHPHSLTTTTDNGLYAAGQITLIVAT